MTQNELQEDVINKTLEFYSKNKKGHLNLAMRSGKTRIAIEIFKRMWPEYHHSTILIAYPDNKLKISWEQELIKWNYNNPNITFINFSSLHK
jgi:predicted helicase